MASNWNQQHIKFAMKDTPSISLVCGVVIEGLSHV